MIGLSRKVPDEFDEEHISKRPRLSGQDELLPVSKQTNLEVQSRSTELSADAATTFVADTQSTLPVNSFQEVPSDVSRPPLGNSNPDQRAKDMDEPFLFGKLGKALADSWVMCLNDVDRALQPSLVFDPIRANTYSRSLA